VPHRGKKKIAPFNSKKDASHKNRTAKVVRTKSHKRMSAGQREMCEDVFDEIDEDGSGSIDVDEMSKAMHVMTGQYPSRRLVKTMFKAVDDDESGNISKEEFKLLWEMQINFKRKLAKANAVKPPLFPQTQDNLLKVFYLFDDPGKSLLGHRISVFIMAVIVMSVTSFVLESMPSLRYWTGGTPGKGQFVGLPVFFAIEVFSIVVFTFEYLIRFALVSRAPPHDVPWYRKIFKFFFSTMNLIDFVAIAPFYVELFLAKNGENSGGGLGVLRILRVARVFRVFKLGKYSNGMQLFASVMARSLPALILLSFFLVIAVVLFGALIFEFEQGVWSDEFDGFIRPDVSGHGKELTPFLSVPSAFWWVVVTSTTVGYGDMYPTTFEGKIVSVMCMMMGVLALALPVSVIGANFGDIYAKKQRESMHKEQKALMQMWKEHSANEIDSTAESTQASNGSNEGGDNGPQSPGEELVDIMNKINGLTERANVLSKELMSAASEGAQSSQTPKQPPPPPPPARPEQSEEKDAV
jgi:hypothetical protein